MKLLARLLIGLFVFANPSPAIANDADGHEQLWNAVQNAGVPIYVNEPSRCNGENSGIYLWNPDTKQGVMVICQDNGKEAGVQVAWTANDLDTLRHEAHHVLQDCLEGEIGDSKFGLFFTYPEKFNEFVTTALTERQIKVITLSYRKAGETDYTIFRELEAFAVARHVSPEIIAKAINKFCSTN